MSVLNKREYLDLITSDDYTHRTYYMGLVDERTASTSTTATFVWLRRRARSGRSFAASEYLGVIAEHVEPWSYAKFCYLKPLGWKGFSDGADTSIYSVAPLARLNAADGMATPLAQSEYERFFKAFGGKPVHHTLANHWARLIELLYAAERMRELAHDDKLFGSGIPGAAHGDSNRRSRRGGSPARAPSSIITRPTNAAWCSAPT